MAQNTSSAVMQQRVEAPDSLDDFPTPSWATRALVEHVLRHAGVALTSCREPTCNRGYMLRPLRETFARVDGSDILDYGIGEPVLDFLFPGALDGTEPFDWMICNPPFRLAKEFIMRGLELAGVGVAVIVRSAFLEGGERYEELFRLNPPTRIAQFAERVIMTKGIVRDPSKPYWDDVEKKMKRPSTATAYCWLVWIKGAPREPFQWIPPCRAKLERPGDYPAVEEAADPR
jgi:hypothetical protein